MKKLILLSGVLLGTALAAHAGINVSIGIGAPAPYPVIVSRPAPVIVPAAPQVVYTQPCQPAVTCAAPAVVYPSPVIVAPAPVYYPAWRGYYRYGGYGWDRRSDYHGYGGHHGRR
jgi:hypothetical protein